MWNAYAEMGLMALPFAEEDGGLGGTPVETMIVMESLGKERDLDGKVRPLDLLDSSKEDKWRIGVDGRRKIIRDEGYAIGNDAPSADMLDMPEHPRAGSGKAQAAAGDGVPNANRSGRDRALIGHQLWDWQGKDRGHVGNSRETVHDVETSLHCFSR